jgi:hypothetical protein
MKNKRLFERIAALSFSADRDAISQPAPLEIRQQPISVEANVGSSLAFFMSITGSGAYRWQFNGRDFPGAIRQQKIQFRREGRVSRRSGGKFVRTVKLRNF